MTKTGVSPLNIAKQYRGDNNEVTEYLTNIGARDISPNMKKAIETEKTESRGEEL
jgi:hypothetical protein